MKRAKAVLRTVSVVETVLAAAQEMVTRGKLKVSFIKISEHAFSVILNWNCLKMYKHGSLHKYNQVPGHKTASQQVESMSVSPAFSVAILLIYYQSNLYLI